MKTSDRKSIPLDYLEIEGIEIEVTKKRTNCSFNIRKLISEYRYGRL